MFFVDPPFPKKKAPDPSECPKPQAAQQSATFDNLPIDAEAVDKNRNARVAYLEAREAVELEQKEMKAVREQVGKEVREMCRPEIDEYIDCCVGRIFTIGACKPQALRMRRCMKKVETPEFVDRRTSEILAERERAGESLVNNERKGTTRERRAMYNRAILSKVEDPNDLLIRNSEQKPEKRA